MPSQLSGPIDIAVRDAPDAFAKASGDSDKTLKVGGGAQGTVDDHTLWYAVDTDGDGITEINAEDIGSLKVRASVCVWAAGKDGKVSSWDDAARSDDVYSWQMNQVVK